LQSLFYRVYNNLSPKWTKIFILEHDEQQSWTPLQIKIHDSRSSHNVINEQRTSVDGHINQTNASLMGGAGLFGGGRELYKSSDPVMGEVNIEVSEILKKEGQEIKLDLQHGGSIFVHITQSIEPLSSSATTPLQTGYLNCHLRGLDLENIEKGLLGLGAIDPYFVLSKKYTDHINGITKWIPVYRSEHIPNIINPYWHPFSIDLEPLCHNNTSKTLKISLWDYEKRGKDRWLGEVEVTVDWLQQCVTKGGNASRAEALSVYDDEQEEVGLIVILKADIISS